MRVSFKVDGTPVPQGSKRVYRGNIVEEHSAELRSWRQDVAARASAQMNGRVMFGPLVVTLVFRLARPKSHYGTGRNKGTLKRSAPPAPQLRPDIDKLTRAVLDALTGVVFQDDAQVVSLAVAKRYDEGSGLWCSVEDWEPE